MPDLVGRYLCSSCPSRVMPLRHDQAGNGVHGRGFPAPLAPIKLHLSVAHLKGDALDRLDHAIADFQIFNFHIFIPHATCLPHRV